MNYSTHLKNLLSETFERKQYKNLPVVFRIFGFIAVFPFIFCSTLLVIYYSILDFVHKLCSSAVNYLEDWLKKTKENTSSLAEAVIYFVTLPFIYFSHIILSILSIAFFVVWFFLECFLYIATLCGIKWRPYINQLDYANDKPYTPKSNVVAAGISLVTLAVLYLVYLILYIIFYVDYNYDVLSAANIIINIYYFAASIALPIIFKKRYTKIITDEDDDDDDDDFELPEV